MPSVAVIGAGISGLAAAYRLQQNGYQVQLFESESRTGGVICSERDGGYLAEWGPNSIQESSSHIRALVRELGLEGQCVEAKPSVNKRYIVRSGQLVALPMTLPALLRSRLFSRRAKLRLLCEPLIPARRVTHEESIADFARRRFGPEVLEYVVNPFVTGIYAGDPEQLSVRYAFPKFYELEQQYGSLIKAQRKSRKTRQEMSTSPAPSETSFSGTIFSFRGGMQTLPDALRQRLGDAVCLNAPVEKLTPAINGWSVTVKQQLQSVKRHVDALVYTAPLYHLSTMGLPSTAEVQAVANVQYTPISILVLGYRREQIGHPLDGFGMLVPAVEPCNIFGTLFSSSMFPGRAPDGHVILTVFIGGARQPDLAKEPSAALLKVAQQDLHRLLGVAGEPTYVNHIFWPKAVPQYELGYGHKQAMIARLERRYPGFFMAGSYRQGVAVGDTLASGYAAAKRLISYFDIEA